MEKPENWKEFFKDGERADPDFLNQRDDDPPQDRQKSNDEIEDE